MLTSKPKSSNTMDNGGTEMTYLDATHIIYNGHLFGDEKLAEAAAYVMKHAPIDSAAIEQANWVIDPDYRR